MHGLRSIRYANLFFRASNCVIFSVTITEVECLQEKPYHVHHRNAHHSFARVCGPPFAPCGGDCPTACGRGAGRDALRHVALLLEDVPATFQADLAHMETLRNEALHEQMRALLGPESVTRYETLQAIRAERRLTKAEQQELGEPALGSRSPDVPQGLRCRASQVARRAHSNLG